MTRDELKECKKLHYNFKYNPYKKKWFVIPGENTEPFAAFIALCSDEEMEEIEKTTEMIYIKMLSSTKIKKESVSLEIFPEKVISTFILPKHIERVITPTVFWLLLCKKYNAEVNAEKSYQAHCQSPSKLLQDEYNKRGIDELAEQTRIVERQIKEIKRNTIIVDDEDEVVDDETETLDDNETESKKKSK